MSEASAEHVANLKKALRKASSKKEPAEALAILEEISKLNVNKKLLQDTRLGKTVGKLRKHEDSKVANASKDLVERWRKTLDDSTSSPPPPGTSNETKEKEEKGKDEKVKEEKGKDSKVKEEDALDRKRKAEKDPKPINKKPKEMPPSNAFDDPTRVKIIELLAQCLADPSGQDQMERDPKNVAVEIEKVLFDHFKGTNNQYKAKYRSISFNLKNPKNPDFRLAVMNGDITPLRLATISPQEMASKEFQEELKKIHDWMVEASKAPDMKNQTTTDMFKCGKCGGRETTYYQMQTRSADEPMTTFHTCIPCGNRWKS